MFQIAFQIVFQFVLIFICISTYISTFISTFFTYNVCGNTWACVITHIKTNLAMKEFIKKCDVISGSGAMIKWRWYYPSPSFLMTSNPLTDVFFRIRLGVNFTNILRAAFSYESFARSFSVLRFRVCTFFGVKISAQKLHVICWWNWLQE